jgi:hypothetical protein
MVRAWQLASDKREQTLIRIEMTRVEPSGKSGQLVFVLDDPMRRGAATQGEAQFACNVEIVGFHSSEIVGDGPIDALINGVGFIRAYVEALAAKGNEIVW